MLGNLRAQPFQTGNMKSFKGEKETKGQLQLTHEASSAEMTAEADPA